MQSIQCCLAVHILTEVLVKKSQMGHEKKKQQQEKNPALKPHLVNKQKIKRQKSYQAAI